MRSVSAAPVMTTNGVAVGIGLRLVPGAGEDGGGELPGVVDGDWALAHGLRVSASRDWFGLRCVSIA
jgi:hypothetical protein